MSRQRRPKIGFQRLLKRFLKDGLSSPSHDRLKAGHATEMEFYHGLLTSFIKRDAVHSSEPLLYGLFGEVQRTQQIALFDQSDDPSAVRPFRYRQGCYIHARKQVEQLAQGHTHRDGG